MLTKDKRTKLIAGTIATIMTLSLTGCKNENPAYAEIEKENEHSSWFPFFGGYFLGRTINSSNNYVTPPPRNNANQNTRTKATAASGKTSQSTSTNNANIGKSGWSTPGKSSVGSAGISGKSGIGSGAARGSAVS